MLLVLAVLGAGLALLAGIGGAQLWTRPFWADELCCTVFPVQDSRSFLDLFGNVTAKDVAPPLLHILVWIAARIAGSASPLLLRALMSTASALALLALYATLRRRFTAVPAGAGTLAVAANALVLHHAFDARFYAPWIFFGALYAWSLGVDGTRRCSRRRDAALALAAICLCTIHWFGVISLTLMAAGALAAGGRRWRKSIRLIAPGAAGLLALLACAPMLAGQVRHGGDILRWVPPLNAFQVWEQAHLFWIGTPMLCVAALLLSAALRPNAVRPRVPAVLDDPAMAALLALSLMPLVLLVISVTLEPVMVPRYGILAALAVAPLAALACETTGWGLRALLLAVLVVPLVNAASREVRESRYYSGTMRAYRTQLAQLQNDHVPMVFQSYFLMYPVDGPRRVQSPARFLELPDSSITALYPDPELEPHRRKLMVDRTFVRVHAHTFGFPTPISQSRLDTTPRFYLFAADVALPWNYRNSAKFGRVLFPHHRATRLNQYVTLFERTPPSP